MMSGCIALDGTFTIAKVPYGSDGAVTACTYVELLEEVVLPLLQQHPGLIFQQDNARSHIAAGPMALLAQEGQMPIEWPPNSPDFSPIGSMLWKTSNSPL
jgi:hypothetical protein